MKKLYWECPICHKTYEFYLLYQRLIGHQPNLHICKGGIVVDRRDLK